LGASFILKIIPTDEKGFRILQCVVNQMNNISCSHIISKRVGVRYLDLSNEYFKQLEQIRHDLFQLSMDDEFKEIVLGDMDLAIHHAHRENILGILNALTVVVMKLQTYLIKATDASEKIEPILRGIHWVQQYLIRKPIEVVGPTGATGATGPSGCLGPMGYTGATGATGLSGCLGPMGYTGATGATGPSGCLGPMGYTGATGATGLSGCLGPMGYTGATGATGPSGCLGPMGYTGATGATGLSGCLGPMGYTGATGATGLSGCLGPMGYTGATGPSGCPGPEGNTGATGPSGANGTTTFVTTNVIPIMPIRKPEQRPCYTFICRADRRRKFE